MINFYREKWHFLSRERSTNYKTRSRGKEVSAIIQRPASHPTRVKGFNKVCYVLWIKRAAQSWNTVGKRILGRSGKWNTAQGSTGWSHRRNDYLFHTPPDNISLLTLPLTSKIPASVLFDLIVRVSRYLRSRWSFKEMETSLSTTLQPFFMRQGWDDSFL